MARDSNLNVGRYTPMISAALAIVLGALLLGLTDISTGAAIVIAVVILAIGLLGVRMLDRRRRSPRLRPPLGECLVRILAALRLQPARGEPSVGHAASCSASCSRTCPARPLRACVSVPLGRPAC